MSTSNRGYVFEDRVHSLLLRLRTQHPKLVEVTRQKRLTLHNGDLVIPDYELRSSLGFQTEAYLIECQSRKRSSSEIVHKIRHIKSLSPRNRFLFVYEDNDFLSESNHASLKSDGVNCYDIDGFESFLSRLSVTLGGVALASLIEDSKRKSLDSSESDTRKEVSAIVDEYVRNSRVGSAVSSPFNLRHLSGFRDIDPDSDIQPA